jgi:hypothetical protein
LYNRYLQQYGNLKNQPAPASSVSSRSAPNPLPAPAQAHKEVPFLSAKGSSHLLPSSLTGIKGLLKGFLGDKMDIGDLLLILILLLLYLEKEDEEILIILSALVFMGFK